MAANSNFGSQWPLSPAAGVRCSHNECLSRGNPVIDFSHFADAAFTALDAAKQWRSALHTKIFSISFRSGLNEEGVTLGEWPARLQAIAF